MTLSINQFGKRITAVAATCCIAAAAQAQISGDVIRIGLITDMSSNYAYLDGPGGAEAIRMAIADMKGEVAGKKIELLVADHQSKADIAASKAREWFDTQGLDMLIAGTNSATGLAMVKVAAEKKKPVIVIGAGSSRVTNEDCTPYSIHYAYDTVALANGTGSAIVKQGGKSWYFLTADYAFGQSLQNDASEVVKKAGGQVVGSIKHPLNASDFSSFLLQAQASKAQILGLANAGGDTVNSIKAANEFGVTKTMKIVGLLMFMNDVHALGLAQAQGLYMTDSWYWDQNAESRAWSRRFFEKMKAMPSSLHAADYSAAMHYLKAVQATKTDDADAVMKKMKEMPINDMYTKGRIRPEDGRGIHDMYVYQTKTPAESKVPYDYLKLVATIPGDQVFTKLADSRCPLVKK